MARDFSFWKYKNDEKFNDEIVYLKLMSDIKVDEVAELPIKNIYKTIQKEFKNWKWESKNYFERNEEAIELYMTGQVVRFDCHCVSNESVNKLIDIMGQYGCPLYDSCISTRFSL